MVGVFFGSFDPPHIGHVNIVTAALNSSIVDKVIAVPAYKSVWKNTETKWEYRLTMAKETFDNIPGVVVDGIEYRIANGEPLPTYKTIEALKEIYGEEDADGWINKIFWGDNLQVMSHLLKEYRGKIPDKRRNI